MKNYINKFYFLNLMFDLIFFFLMNSILISNKIRGFLLMLNLLMLDFVIY